MSAFEFYPKSVPEGPHVVDRHVGLRIRMRRKELEISQEELAETVGVTFQQVQKYERGINRVSASNLWVISRSLQVPVDYFYQGLGESEGQGALASLTDSRTFLLTPEGPELAETFPKLADPKLRRSILNLIRQMVEQDAGH